MNVPAPTTSSRPLWQRLLLRRLKFLAALALLIVVALGGSYLFAPQWLMRAHAMWRASEAGLSSRTVTVGDTSWSYYEGGDGPTLLLLHGFGADKGSWVPVAKLLTPHFHVVIPDLPGWGDSTRVPGASYDIDAQAQRLDGFVRALDLRSFVLVGHSMGGAIAGVYAAGHPDTVRELALVDSFGLKANPNAFTTAVQAGNDPFLYRDRAGFEALLTLVFAKPPHIPGRIVDALVQRNERDRDFIASTFADLRQPSQYLSLQNRLDQLTMPVMGLWCSGDKVIDISALDSLRNGLGHSPAISTSTLIGCGHMPMLEKPDETARILTGFALSH